MNKRFFRNCILFLLLLCVSDLEGFQTGRFNFFVTNELLININNTYERSEQFYETLSIFSNIKKWSFSLTLRSNNFFKRAPNTTLEKTNFDVFRKSVRFNSKRVKLTLGNLYSVLGHGLVLSVQKNDTIFRERTIFGADIKYLGNWFDLRLLGGEIEDDTFRQKWNMIGGEADIRLSKKYRAGVRFSFIDDIDTLRGLGNRMTFSLNLKGNQLLKYFSYYTEFAILDFVETAGDRGRAVYSNITFSRSHITILLEYKNYRDFDSEMNNPPIADREDEIATLSDTEGIRGLFQYTIFDPEISFFLNIGKYREYDENGTHIYGGVSVIDLDDRFSFNLSYGIKKIIYPIKKFNLDLIWQISESISMSISSKDKRYADNKFRFNEQDHTMQLSHSKGFSTYLIYQYSHNRIIGLNHFYNGGITLNLRNNLEIRLSGGTNRGGQICSGGQCYILPPFKGLKFSLLKTFK